jgi:hypothetical protein
MGASSYVQTIHGDNLEDAYRRACSDAGYEHGNSYSGAINMSNGIFLADQRARLPWDAEAAAQRLIDGHKVQKWESVGAIRLAKPLSERTITLTVDTTDCAAGWSPQDEITLKASAAVRLKLKDGEGIISLDTTNSEKVRAEATTPGGAAKVVYYIHPPWVAGRVARHATFESQAEARAAALEAVRSAPEHVNEVSVRAKKVASDGSENLVTVKRVVTKRTTTVVAKVGVVGEPVNSWMVAGVYAS